MKKFRPIKSIACIILAAAVVFTSGCGSQHTSPSGDGNDEMFYSYFETLGTLYQEAQNSSDPAPVDPDVPVPDHNTIDLGTDMSLDELPRNSFDQDKMDSLISDFEEHLKTPGNDDELIDTYDELLLQLDALSTDGSLAYYDHSADAANEEKSDAYQELNDMYVEYADELCTLFSRIFDAGSYYDDVFTEYMGEDIASEFAEYEPLTKKESDLLAKQTELSIRYDELMAENYDPEAESYSEDEAVPAWVNDAKELYIETVNVNNEYARLNGYDNYADYVYSEVYSRDYTVDDVFASSDVIKDRFQQLYKQTTYSFIIKGDIISAFDLYTANIDEMLDNFVSAIYEIDDRLGDAAYHMASAGLIDTEYSDTKTSGAYTSSLPLFRDAYIFNDPAEDYTVFSTLVHEFGHYNYYLYNFVPDLLATTNLDIAEVHSQGLELLFYDSYHLLDKEHAEGLKDYVVYSIMDSVLSGYAVNEAEYKAHTTDDLTIEKLDDIFNEAGADYGIPESLSADVWYLYPHIYQSPFYYISYGTSALASLELFVKAQNDPAAGVDCYMALTEVSMDEPFLDILSEVGLNDIFDPDNVESLVSSLTDILDIETDY